MKIFIYLMLFVVAVVSVLAIPFTPKAHMNLQNYSIYNASDVYALHIYRDNVELVNGFDDPPLPCPDLKAYGAISYQMYQNATHRVCGVYDYP